MHRKPLILALAALLTACGVPPGEPSAPALAPQALPGAGPALLSRYGRIQSGGLEKYDSMTYRPRQFRAGLVLETGATHFGTQTVSNAGLYAGWDALSLPNLYDSGFASSPNYVTLALNRPARMGLIWRAADWKPSWLSGWAKGGNVTLTDGRSYPVYTRDFPAGTVNLPGEAVPNSGSYANGRQNYSVLLAEQGGTASAAPGVPAGQTLPTPNTTCPAWVHDAYVAQGPDGKTYPTWHPQIDPVYWCSFGHEHGSDPSLTGSAYRPLYGYTAAAHGMAEPHEGFKTHTFRDRTTGHWWSWTVHFGTSGPGRICQQYHTFDVAVVAGGTVKADIHLMGDFGRARYFTGVPNEVALITGCPVSQTTIRDMGSRTIGSPSTDGYEPWVVDNEYNVTGLKPMNFSVKTNFTRSRCATVPACTTLESRTDAAHNGADRILEFGRPSIMAGSHGQNVGEFWTDHDGVRFVAPGSPMSVRQYVAPGFTSTVTPPADVPTKYCSAREAWRVEYLCDSVFLSGDKNLENGLRSPN